MIEAAVIAAIASIVVAVIGQWRNKKDHLKGYTVLQSIDARTISIQDKQGEHSEWIAAHDARYPNGHKQETRFG
jgi:hypothetical protein